MASAGETIFLNDALGQIGASPISSIDDPSPNARWCKTFWPKLRQALLRTANWNFAQDRMQLSQVPASEAPPFEFAFGYTIPAYILKIKEFNGAKIDTSVVTDFGFLWPGRYIREGQRLLTNEGEVKVVFVRDVDNMELWDPLTYQMAASWLASKLALAIPKDAAKSRELLAQAQAVWNPLALAVDGQEQTTMPYVSDNLIWGR